MRVFSGFCIGILVILVSTSSKALPVGVRVGAGLLAPAGDFGQDLRGSMSLSLGLAVFPVEKLKVGLEASYASLKGKGETDLALELLGGEASARYTLYSFTEDVSLYGLMGIGNTRFTRTLGTGEEKGYQMNIAVGAGGDVRVRERTSLDGGIKVGRYLSDKTGDVFLLSLGLWYGL
jgi:opacity protein-like surface antigen